MAARRGLRSTATRAGLGVHSGVPAHVRLSPAPVGSGITFHTPAGSVPALLSCVVASEQRTALARDGARVETVEHVLAACCGLALDDVAITLDGPEAPILDGSAHGWVEALREAGIVETPGQRTRYVVQSAVEVRDGERFARLEPAEGLHLDLQITFDDPAIGSQRFQGAISPDYFAREIAPARTFGDARDLARLQAVGLGLGASLANTLAFADGRFLNAEGLRFADEPVRHKALDVLGDLALLGRPLQGRLSAERPGHGLTHALLRKALAQGRLIETAAA